MRQSVDREDGGARLVDDHECARTAPGAVLDRAHETPAQILRGGGDGRPGSLSVSKYHNATTKVVNQRFPASQRATQTDRASDESHIILRMRPAHARRHFGHTRSGSGVGRPSIQPQTKFRTRSRVASLIDIADRPR
jgi:hypothetical protein